MDYSLIILFIVVIVVFVGGFGFGFILGKVMERNKDDE
jgi:hypothetical protein